MKRNILLLIIINFVFISKGHSGLGCGGLSQYINVLFNNCSNDNNCIIQKMHTVQICKGQSHCVEKIIATEYEIKNTCKSSTCLKEKNNLISRCSKDSSCFKNFSDPLIKSVELSALKPAKINDDTDPIMTTGPTLPVTTPIASPNQELLETNSNLKEDDSPVTDSNMGVMIPEDMEVIDHEGLARLIAKYKIKFQKLNEDHKRRLDEIKDQWL